MLRMKCAALVASLFLRVLSCPGATGESGSCQGKTVDVFLDSSFISGGDYFPDTYVKMNVGGALSTSRVVRNETYAAFKQWFTFTDPQSNTLKIEVWDEGRSLRKDDVKPVGGCLIHLRESVSGETCTFDKGQVSLIYVCV